MAAKRHYSQSKRARHDEHMGMEKHERGPVKHHTMHSGYYAGAHDRRRQELEDAGMIHEDHNAIANMPQEVMIKPWPAAPRSYVSEGLDDTIRGVDRQMDVLDGEKRDKNLEPKKV